MTSMPDTKQLLRETRDRIAPPSDVLDGLERRRRHKDNMKRVAAAAVAIVVAIIGLGGWFLLDRSQAPTPADRSEELGIFAPVAGRIVYENQNEGLWAVDPNGPSDTTEGPSVAADVASTLIPADFVEAVPGLEDVTVHGWSRDGTELLFQRNEEYSNENLIPEGNLYILHADGSETRLNEEKMDFAGAAISPDGKLVAFAADGLYVVDADGGQPVRIAQEGSSPTFSPDGTHIAYLVYDDNIAGNIEEEHVWIVDVDGGNAHEILADEPTVFLGVSGLRWSPAGDRLALGVGGFEGAEALAIYTFASDGSDFTRVITGGESPYWSPDGSQIAYTILCGESSDTTCPVGSILRSQFDAQPRRFGGGSAGLAIADADGSNVREFGFAASGPWHPGVSATGEPVPSPVETPTPIENDDTVPPEGEVLGFTGEDGPGDLVAVNPQTGETRVLLSDLGIVFWAQWSADRRWVLYEARAGLRVVGPEQEPRMVTSASDDYLGWASWSPTGARLAHLEYRLRVLDFASNSTTDLGTVTGDVTAAPVWSPDGTRLVYGTAGGAVTAVDVESGGRSLVVELPDENLDSINEIDWSPDGEHLAIFSEHRLGGGRVYLVNADGSDVRVLLDDVDLGQMAWSPEGGRLAYIDISRQGKLQVFTRTLEGDTPVLVGEVVMHDGCCMLPHHAYPVWSPDGSQIAVYNGSEAFAVDADGTGDVEPIDRLTYSLWNDGAYD
jgi:Tol biopolymer transport system component